MSSPIDIRVGQYKDANLAIAPHNGWSLYGLGQSLTAQGKHQAAATVKQQWEAAGQDADAKTSL